MSTALTPNMITVSPITRYGANGWTWTVSEAVLDFDAGEHVVIATRFRTDASGTGLWVEGRPVDRQILGFLQMDLRCSASTRRERVLGKAIQYRSDSEQGMSWRQVYANRPRIVVERS